jgi:hypothetical protein
LHLDAHIIEATSNTPAIASSTPRLSYRLIPPSTSTSRARRPSLAALFPITSVCRILRAETLPLVYGNSFAFSDKGYDYATTFPLFISSLTRTQKRRIKTIYYPLRPSRDIQAGILALPDRALAETWRELVGLEKVVLKWIATDVGNKKLGVEEKREFERRYGEPGQWGLSG